MPSEPGLVREKPGRHPVDPAVTPARPAPVRKVRRRMAMPPVCAARCVAPLSPHESMTLYFTSQRGSMTQIDPGESHLGAAASGYDDLARQECTGHWTLIRSSHASSRWSVWSPSTTSIEGSTDGWI